MQVIWNPSPLHALYSLDPFFLKLLMLFHQISCTLVLYTSGSIYVSCPAVLLLLPILEIFITTKSVLDLLSRMVLLRDMFTLSCLTETNHSGTSLKFKFSRCLIVSLSSCTSFTRLNVWFIYIYCSLLAITFFMFLGPFYLRSYHHLHKHLFCVIRLPVRWDKTVIVVMNEVRVSSPYHPENVSGGTPAANDRVKKVVSGPFSLATTIASTFFCTYKLNWNSSSCDLCSWSLKGKGFGSNRSGGCSWRPEN